MPDLITPLLGILAQFYSVTGNLGLAIIAFTVVVRSLLLPLTLPSIKAQKKITSIQPELKKLKAKHSGDKQALQVAQMELYKKYNINPLAGCIPQLVQIGILIFLYRALLQFVTKSDIGGIHIEPFFLWLNLGKPDPMFVLPVLAGVTQLVLSLMIAPATEVPDQVPNTSKLKKVQEANKKEEDVAEMAATMQQQMIFMMPIMTGIFALRFPSGLALYWIITTVFSIAQQYFLSGPGGLTSYARRAWYMIRGRL